MVYTHNGILLSYEKNEISLFATTWMDVKSTMLSEVSQTEKTKFSMISLTYRIYKNNEQT